MMLISIIGTLSALNTEYKNDVLYFVEKIYFEN